MTDLPNTLVTERGTRVCFDAPVLMGIINLTPDSFSDGGRYRNTKQILSQARALVEAGARILDIGGESSRPGSEPVELDEERRRVLPAIEALVDSKIGVPISIDTTKAALARDAVSRGAEFINDISALSDPHMAPLAASYGTGLILMHMRGVPKTMQTAGIEYNDVVSEVHDHLKKSIDEAIAAGVQRSRIIVDPGIGFGKELSHNIALSTGIRALHKTGCRVLYGPSRKRFLGELTGREVTDRDRATAAACALAAYEGADIFRVHNVGAVVDAVKVAYAMRSHPG